MPLSSGPFTGKKNRIHHAPDFDCSAATSLVPRCASNSCAGESVAWEFRCYSEEATRMQKIADRAHGSLLWLYDQANFDTIRFKQFLKCRPLYERKLRRLLREPIPKNEQAEKRDEMTSKLEEAIDIAEKCAGPEDPLVVHGVRRLQRLRDWHLEDQDTKAGVCGHDDGLRDIFEGDVVVRQICDHCGWYTDILPADEISSEIKVATRRRLTNTALPAADPRLEVSRSALDGEL